MKIVDGDAGEDGDDDIGSVGRTVEDGQEQGGGEWTVWLVGISK